MSSPGQSAGNRQQRGVATQGLSSEQWRARQVAVAAEKAAARRHELLMQEVRAATLCASEAASNAQQSGCGLAPGPSSGGRGGDIRGSSPTLGAAAATRLDSWHFSEMLASAFYDLAMRHSASYMRHV